MLMVVRSVVMIWLIGFGFKMGDIWDVCFDLLWCWFGMVNMVKGILFDFVFRKWGDRYVFFFVG